MAKKCIPLKVGRRDNVFLFANIVIIHKIFARKVYASKVVLCVLNYILRTNFWLYSVYSKLLTLLVKCKILYGISAYFKTKFADFGSVRLKL